VGDLLVHARGDAGEERAGVGPIGAALPVLFWRLRKRDYITLGGITLFQSVSGGRQRGVRCQQLGPHDL
jgi:hypothetical protein